MTINGTIFVQAVNFGIAYVLLRELLCKPAIEAIRTEQQVEQTLHGAIEDKKTTLQEKQVELYQQKLTGHRHFIKNRPNIKDLDLFVFSHITPPVVQAPIEEQQIERLTKQMTENLVKRMSQHAK